MRKVKVKMPSGKKSNHLSKLNRRRGSVELEAVLITALMFPLATALYYLAIRAFSVFHRMIAGIMEWPYLLIGGP